MYRRRKRRLPFAAYAALLFNATLFVSPFIAAQTMFTAYGREVARLHDSDASMAATRRAINARFSRLADEDGNTGREAWTNLIRMELEAGEMSAVRGFLLAAPSMLSGDDLDSLKARIAVADAGGDEALINAALAYLPEDVRALYERRSASVIQQLSDAAPADEVEEAPEPDVYAADEDASAQFSVLGDLRDLSLAAARWTRNDKIDEFSFVLSGVGLILADPPARQGASIVMSAARAESLDPQFSQYLERRLFQTAPPQRVKRLLTSRFSHEFGYVTDGPQILRDVFAEAADSSQLQILLKDFRVIRDIAAETSPMAAVTILSEVKTSSDLRRARLVARAGGDKAVALALNDGDRLLDNARIVIVWSKALGMQVAACFACVALLAYIAMNVAWKSFRRNAPIRRSAVYALEEISPV